MSDYNLNGIKISAEEFLGAFFEAGDTVCIRIFSNKKGSAFSGQKMEIEQGHFHTIEEGLRNHNEQERGIYFVVNHGGHEDADIRRITAQFMECDGVSLDEQLAKIKAFPLEPSLIIKTRNSLHTYWLIRDGKVENFRCVQRGLIAHFEANPQCVNESRVFRIPGFYHNKEEPVMVECVKFSPHLRYTQQKLEAVLPIMPEEKPSDAFAKTEQNRGNQLGLKIVGLKCQFIKHCSKNAKTLSEPRWYAMITNLAVFRGGDAAIHKLSKPYPKYSFDQTEAKIAHFHKSGTKPMTCAKIAENGFVCPNRKTCKGKSPAGLAYFPLDMKDIRKRLDACKITNLVVEDVATVRELVDDYMYNIDSGMVEAFLNSEVKAKFGFKGPELKRLVGFHKETYKQFYNSPQSKQERAGRDIPAWYEYTDSGLRFMPGVLADHCAENAHAFYCGESYYFYKNGVYKAETDKAAENFIRTHMYVDRHKTYYQISDAEKQWGMQIDKYINEVNANPYLINFGNGLYDTLTNELLPHDPKILTTIRVGGNYDPKAECPLFLKYLHDALPKSEIPLVQEMMGYMLVALNKAQKAFIMLGKPDSGKSTLLYVIQDVLLRKENCSSLEWQKLNEKFATVDLFGKLANIFADLPSEQIRDTGIFKTITGEDYISAQHKFKAYFSFKPFCRMVFSCEALPKNYYDRSGGFYRRLIIIRFDNPVDPKTKDRSLREKLKLEVDGILAWSLIGLKRLMANEFCFSETDRTIAEVKKYRADNSSSLSFVYECCVTEPKAEIPRDDLYNAYKEFCSDNGVKSVLSKINFNRDLDELGLTRATTAGRRTWRGIRLS